MSKNSKKKLKEFQEKERQRLLEESQKRAQPSQSNGTYCCDKCGTECYYDGRCGDGPILMCNCNRYEDNYYSNERR